MIEFSPSHNYLLRWWHTSVNPSMFQYNSHVRLIHEIVHGWACETNVVLIKDLLVQRQFGFNFHVDWFIDRVQNSLVTILVKDKNLTFDDCNFTCNSTSSKGVVTGDHDASMRGSIEFLDSFDSILFERAREHDKSSEYQIRLNRFPREIINLHG